MQAKFFNISRKVQEPMPYVGEMIILTVRQKNGKRVQKPARVTSVNQAERRYDVVLIEAN